MELHHPARLIPELILARALSTDDMEATVADLRANGVEVEVRNPYLAFARGPDNVRIELETDPIT